MSTYEHTLSGFMFPLKPIKTLQYKEQILQTICVIKKPTSGRSFHQEPTEGSNR